MQPRCLSLFLAWRILSQNKPRTLVAVLGLSVLFFLSVSQVALFIGWCNTVTAIPRHTDADVWVMAERTAALDYATAIPRHRIHQVRNVRGVAWAEGLYTGWVFWQRADGRYCPIELVGLDESHVGGPWDMREGSVDSVRLPHGLIVDELYLDYLGVQGIGDEAQVNGERATVRGISRDVRTLTAAPFAFTSLREASRYDKTFDHRQHTKFVIVRAEPGVSAEELARRINEEVPSVEALTSQQLRRRTIRYWMLETGLGATVILSAVLGLAVSAVVAGQTLYTITQERIGDYGTCAAIGFGRGRLLRCVTIQGLMLSAAGVLLGGLGFAGIMHASARTPIPLEMTLPVFMVLVAVIICGSLIGSLLSVRAVWKLDPALVFRR